MTQSWLGWLVRDYQKEVIEVVEKLKLRMELVGHEDEPGCLAIYVDPPEGYANANILSEEAYEARDTLHPDKELHHQGLSQITGSCGLEGQFDPHIWFEARRGCPSDYFGTPRPVRVGEVYQVRDYCHMLARHDHWPRKGIVIPDEEIDAKLEEMRERHFPGCEPSDRKCSFMCSIGMIFPDWLKWPKKKSA